MDLIGTFASSFLNDLRYSVRTLAKNPGFTGVAVFALALGIGLNTGIFSVLNAVALRPLEVPRASEIVSVSQFISGAKIRNVHESGSFFSWAEYKTYRDANHVFSGLAAYAPFEQVILGGPQPRQIFGQLTSCNYFDVLRQPPALGRTFNASDCAVDGAGTVVVLSNELWRDSFASDPSIIGRTVRLNRQPLAVIGVARSGFRGTELIPAFFWTPVTLQPQLFRDADYLPNPNTSWLAMLGRIKPGTSMDQVRAELAVIAGRIDRLSPPRQTSIQVHSANLLSIPDERNFVAIVGAVLLVAVGMVLLIACANVASLLLARAAGRRKEIAIRLSVGASRGRLIRQLLTESLLVALAGGVLGSLIALGSFSEILRLAIAQLPPEATVLSLDLRPDLRVLGYTLGLSLFTGIVFGLIPALQASRPDLNAALKDAGAGMQSGSGGFLRNGLVGVQVAVSMVLLIAAGLLLRGLLVIETVDPGFEMRNLLAVSFELRNLGYDDQHAALLQSQIRERVSSLPGVDGTAQVTQVPLSSNHYGTGFKVPGRKDEYGVEFTEVSPEFFSLLKIPMVRGRDFTTAETQTGAPVVIVPETTARRIWPNEDPIGKVIQWDGGRDLEVIGVAKDAQVSHLSRTDGTYAYLPAGPKEQKRATLLVHCAAGCAGLSNTVREAVHHIGPDLALDVKPLEDNLERWRGPSRIVASLAGALGGLGMLLACVGVYGVVSYAVSRRVREIGIRMTLGADARKVKSLILRQAMGPVLIGALIGMALCAGVSQILKSLLYGVSTHDPLAFIGVPLVLLAVALLASYVPARRATRVDPMVALRYE